jgi:carboxypeptidase family protein/TonB-dependent receptor-like protein
LARLLVALCGLILTSSSVRAQAIPQPARAVEIVVSTQGGTVRLPGATVTIDDIRGVPVSSGVSDNDGRFRLSSLADGSYRVTSSLEGFQPTTVTMVVGARPVSVTIDMPIALATSVDVTPVLTAASATDAIASRDTVDSKQNDEFAEGGAVRAALKLLASVFSMPGGVSIKGGRPDQAATQLGTATLVDPSTGLVRLTLPPDAIDSVSVLANPYAVEFGRFSSGVVVLQTRRAGDRWRARLNNFDPGFRTKRHDDFHIVGLRVFAPRFEVGGPLIANRLFLEQTAQYRYDATEIPSRPQDEVRVDRWLSSFTRLDGTLSPRHAFTATGGLSPSRAESATLGTFTPPDATVDIRDRIRHVAVNEHATWNDHLLSESMFRVQTLATEIDPLGMQPMLLLPETTLGNFFNQQTRHTATYQWIHSVTATAHGLGGRHVMKAGIDLLHSRYDGTSASRPVLIADSNRSLVRQLDFDGPARQDVSSTDLALFAQDRFEPSNRWYVEVGGRIDRDGVLDRVNVTPRAGAGLLFGESGSGVLRGGYGLFYHRTPSIVGAFDEFDGFTETRFASDGVTPSTAPIYFTHVVSPDLRPSRAASWNVTYDHRVSRRWSFHGGVLARNGRHELIVDPVRTATGGELRLRGDGQSRYRDAEAGVHFTQSTLLDIDATYVRSSARGDLNAVTTFFDAVRSPVIGANAYAPLGSDIPHRLLARGRLAPTARWLFLGVADWHTGSPYSTVDAALDYVGLRNAFRFPAAFKLELGIERRVKIRKWDPWLGVRIFNAFNRFLPTDVQGNVASPAFGNFYNSEIRRLMLQFRFAR